MSEAEHLHGEEHVRRYRETDGAVGHIWRRGAKVLLLTTTGRRTGQPRTTPLIYENAGDGYVIVASKGGADEHPGWYRNLVADPNVEVQVLGRGLPRDRPHGTRRGARGALAPGGAPVAGLRPLPDEDGAGDPGRRPRAALSRGQTPATSSSSGEPRGRRSPRARASTVTSPAGTDSRPIPTSHLRGSSCRGLRRQPGSRPTSFARSRSAISP